VRELHPGRARRQSIRRQRVGPPARRLHGAVRYRRYDAARVLDRIELRGREHDQQPVEATAVPAAAFGED